MSKAGGRIELIDFIRGADIYAMIFYHFVYDLAMFGAVSWGFVYSWPMQLLERVSASAFILIAGLSCRLSRDNLRRGALVFALGIAVSLCSALAGVTIRFGILQLLGSSMMLFALLGRRLDRLPEYALPCICLPMFCAGYYVYRQLRFDIGWLYPLGLRGHGFVSADYFPLWPWFFLFLMGAWLGKRLLAGGRRPWMERKYPRWGTVPGRHTLVIYLVHQPLLYPAAMLLARLAG